MNGVNGHSASPEAWEYSFFAHLSSFTTSFARYHPKNLAGLSLTRMISVLATLKNLRRGHDAQGHIKRIQIGSASETYENYMAPARVQYIAHQVETKISAIQADTTKSAEAKAAEIAQWRAVYGGDILCPETATFLSPEWDEFLPFPTTWKLRFEGFGWSDYGGRETLGGLKLRGKPMDDFAPFYEAPGGASRVGGSFAASSCAHAGAGSEGAGSGGTLWH